jgi:hypothetical protein
LEIFKHNSEEINCFCEAKIVKLEGTTVNHSTRNTIVYSKRYT